MDWYLDVLRKYKDKLLRITRYLWYAHDGVRTGKRGRPRIKGEKIDFEKLDLQRCKILDIEGGRAYSVKTYSKAMKRNIKVVVHYPESGGHKVYFSTDLEMSAKDITEYYRTRFQIEFCFRDSKQFTGLNDCQARDLRKLFCFRDSKQFTGLNDCQARDLRKLDFAFNASLASVNIAKVMRQRYYPSLSIGLLKTYLSNIYMLKRIFSKSGLKPNRTLNAKLVKTEQNF